MALTIPTFYQSTVTFSGESDILNQNEVRAITPSSQYMPEYPTPNALPEYIEVERWRKRNEENTEACEWGCRRSVGSVPIETEEQDVTVIYVKKLGIVAY